MCIKCGGETTLYYLRLQNAQKYLNFCVALLDDLHLSLEYDALVVANDLNPWTENSQQ